MDREAIERAVREVVAHMESEARAPKALPRDAVACAGSQTLAAPCSGVESGAPEGAIAVEVSARHVHLSLEDLRALFGRDDLPSLRAISQPGQYLSTLRVRLIGPRGVLDDVAVLGPVRGATQAEISATDARFLGVRAPVNLSGDLSGAATVFIQAGDRLLQRACAIIARRHVHMTPEQAKAFGVVDGEEVSLAVAGARPIILTGVVARVSPQSALALHIDTDEANAAGAWGSTACRMVRVPQDAFVCGARAAADPSAQSTPVEAATSCRLSNGSQSTASPSAAPCGQVALEGKLICESAVLALPKEGVAALRLKRGQLITPLALDALRARGITLLREERA